MYDMYPDSNAIYTGEKPKQATRGVVTRSDSLPSAYGNRERSEAQQRDPSLAGGLGHTATWYPEMEQLGALVDVPRPDPAVDRKMGYVCVNPMVAE